MGASTKHRPGQHTFEHRLFADAKQPLDAPNCSTEFDTPNFTHYDTSDVAKYNPPGFAGYH
ncbi:MAG TPA: hypothetical protein VL156_19975 [Terriglobales bacterium]|jgi:hypothetical protein|nr:hypothetical protein [Terriglobales bacterium]